MSLTLIDRLWYGAHPLRWLLWPFSMVYQGITVFRRHYLQCVQTTFSVPVIVVGNITVGGVGKTPLVIALAKAFQSRGLKVGIVSRGYGAEGVDYPYEVTSDDDAVMVGDEPLLLVKKIGCPVVIAPKRVKAVEYLLTHHQSQIIISDDGLQHYAMGRSIEIAVIDGIRGVGNGYSLPAGPLREGVERLQHVDFVVINGASRVMMPLKTKTYQMDLVPGEIVALASSKKVRVSELAVPVAAIAAIGHPQRFFSTLKGMGLAFNEYSFKDHHQFKPDDLSFAEQTIVMTEKDAVKCLPFATKEMYFVPVDAQIESDFWTALWKHKHLQGYI